MIALVNMSAIWTAAGSLYCMTAEVACVGGGAALFLFIESALCGEREVRREGKRRGNEEKGETNEWRGWGAGTYFNISILSTGPQYMNISSTSCSVALGCSSVTNTLLI